MQKRLIISLLLPLLMFWLCTGVCAVENLEPNKQCSITFLLDFDGTPLNGGKLTLYRVGQIDKEGDKFVPVDPLQQDELSFDNLQDPELSETLLKLAVEHELTPCTDSISDGKAVFSDLQTGVYVVSQHPGDETAGYAAIKPFLLSLPQWQDGEYIYDLTATPKVPLVPSSTEPTDPTKPTEPNDTPNFPQTGQLNWPVPLMAVLGIAIFGLGWYLFFSTKRREI